MIARYVRTIAHLTPEQIVARAWLSARSAAYARSGWLARAAAGGPAPPRPGARPRLARWLELKYRDGVPAGMVALAASVRAGSFPFVGRSVALGAEPFGRAMPRVTPLWRYHLHYFDHLLALALAREPDADAGLGWRWVDSWIRTQPPGARPAWEPYPAAVRIANWAAAWAVAADAPDRDAWERASASLAMQARWLVRHLEHHIGGNHLIKDARGLIVAGVLFSGDGDRWSRRGKGLLVEEVARQVLADGGHFELTPMYQAEVLEDLLDCIVLLEGDAAAASLRATASRMAVWLRTLRHPDGGIAQLNDSVAFPEPSVAWILAYAARVLGEIPADGADERAVALAASGIYALGAPGSRMVIDCGEIGPPHLAAHAHADTLTYELTWGARRIVVDTGVAEYRAGRLRDHVRSTRAHNTVLVDGQDQSEVWSSHRAGRRAHPLGAVVDVTDDAVRFSGAHDGYRALGVVHHRHVIATRGAWIVVDDLDGTGTHDVESWIHLSPAARVALEGARAVLSGVDDLPPLAISALTPCAASVVRTWQCPGWGTALRSPALRLSLRAAAPVLLAYAIARADLPVELSIRSRAGGIAVEGAVGGQPVSVRSDRATILGRSRR